MKVYVVTSGSYSDYGIRHIFSTREAAQALLNDYHRRAEAASAVASGTRTSMGAGSAYNDYGGYNPYIDEWEVLDAPPELHEHWTVYWSANPRKDDDNITVHCSEIDDRPAEEGVSQWATDGLTIAGKGRSKEAAEKAMFDRLAFLRAQSAGIA